MNEIAHRISRVMSGTQMVAASLDEVLQGLNADGGSELGAPEVVEAVLRRPDHYRLFNPMRGAWTASRLCRSPGPYGPPLQEQYITPEPWIILLDETEDGREGGGDPVERWTRRTLVCLGRNLDHKSPAAVNRWLRLLREHRRLRDRRRAVGLRFSYTADPLETRRKVPAHHPSSASSSAGRSPNAAAS